MLPVRDTFMNREQRGIQKGSRGLSQVLSWNVRVLVSQDRDKDDDIGVSDI